MSYQDLTKNERQIEQIVQIKGEKVIGLKLKAPLASFDVVYCLPMLSISMSKGTGVVTSVPSDSPDDFAVLREF